MLQFQKKGVHLNTIERFCIYKEASTNSYLSDDGHTIPNSKIFEIILKEFQEESRYHPAPLTLPMPTSLTQPPRTEIPQLLPSKQ
jgi:hypothetical protein